MQEMMEVVLVDVGNEECTNGSRKLLGRKKEKKVKLVGCYKNNLITKVKYNTNNSNNEI